MSGLTVRFTSEITQFIFASCCSLFSSIWFLQVGGRSDIISYWTPQLIWPVLDHCSGRKEGVNWLGSSVIAKFCSLAFGLLNKLYIVAMCPQHPGLDIQLLVTTKTDNLVASDVSNTSLSSLAGIAQQLQHFLPFHVQFSSTQMPGQARPPTGAMARGKPFQLWLMTLS